MFVFRESLKWDMNNPVSRCRLALAKRDHVKRQLTGEKKPKVQVGRGKLSDSDGKDVCSRLACYKCTVWP